MMRVIFLLITMVYAMNILSQNQRIAYVGDEIQLYAPSSNDSKRKTLHRVFWSSNNSCVTVLKPTEDPTSIRITAEGTANIKCAAEFYDPYFWSINDPLYGSDYSQTQITQITCIKKNNGNEPGGGDIGGGDTGDKTIPNPKLGEGWTNINGSYFCAVQTEEGVTMKFGNSGNNRKCWTFYWAYGESALGVCINPTTSGKVTIPSSVEGCTTSWIGRYSFRDCNRLTEVVIPNTVESINYAAFWGCSSLTTVTIPASVTEIYDAAFDECTALTTVTCLGTTPPKGPSSGDPFRWRQYNMTLYVPKGAKTAYETSPIWSGFKEIREIGAEGMEKITLNVSPSSGEVTSGSKVYISTPNVVGADIYYTLNGSTPTKNSTLYTSSGITINKSCTLKAIAYKSGYEDSEVLAVTYTIPTTTDEGASEDVNVPTSISLPSSITLKVGETILLTPIISPEGAETTLSGLFNADGTIRLSYYNNNTQFLISSIKEGNSYVIAKTDNGLTSRCNITVSGYNPSAKGDGTRYNPYNAVGAFLHAASLPYNEPTAERYYVKGKVLEIKEQFGTKYSNATFYLSDDGTIKNSFHIYRTNYLNNKFFEEGDDTLKVGDEVLIYGKLIFYYNDTNGYSFIPEMASNQSYIVSINGKGEQALERDVVVSSAGYATFYSSESAYTLPNGLSAQVVTSVTNGKLTYKTIADGSISGIVPKGTAVMLVSDAKRASTYTLAPTESTTTYSGSSLLRGSDVATTVQPGSNEYVYKLSYGQSGGNYKDVFGWYWGSADGNAFQIDGHKAWLVVPKTSSGGTRGYTIEGDATGIDVINTDNESVYHDLQGRRISKPVKKGIYIRNGKIVINH